MRILLGTLGVAAATAGLSGCVMIGDIGPMDRYHSDFHYSYQVQPKVRIDAESFNGAIEIDGWDRNEVEISGVKSASTEAARDAIKIDIHNTPDSVEVRAVKPPNQQNSMGAKFTIHVPRGAELDRITTSNGPIKVSDVNRAAHLRTSNGGINLAGVRGEVTAQTSNGPIDAEAIKGAVVLKSSNGHIHADRIDGSFEAETSNSGIVARLSSSPSTTVKLNTSNGAIDLTMEKPPQSDVRAETRNGPITVHLPSDTSAKLSAGTSNSGIDSEFEVTGDRDRHHLTGTIGSGGHAIELNTSNARIRIRKGAAR
jgi:DUF4097 and DUF4098 domain-containing protein YvlB